MDGLKFLMDNYRSWLLSRVSLSTSRKYHTDALRFIAERGHPVYIDSKALHQWFETESRTVAPATSNRKLAAIRMLYKFLKIRGLREDDPTDMLEDRRLDKRLPNPVDHKDILRLLALIREKPGKWAVQDLAILETLYGSGVRREECATLRLRHIVNREVLQVFGKGRKERLTILTEQGFRALVHWVAVHLGEGREGIHEEIFFQLRAEAPDTPIFYTQSGKPFLSLKDPGHYVYLRVRAYAKELGLDARPHRFRHSFGTELVDKEVPLQDVADVMGHGSIQTTRGYVARGEKGLRAIRRKHSRTEEAQP